MFRPQIEKTHVLLILTFFSLSLVYFVQFNTIFVEKIGIEEKKKSTQIMEMALSTLKKEVKSRYEAPILKDIDPNLTGLIFTRPNSPMVTYSGDLESKQTVLKPNFAALMVDLFMKAGLERKDTIAVGMTGSMPGANIALYAACKAMDIIPIVISSVGASQYGATDSNFTWLDMEKILFDKKIISHKSIAASLGGKGDSYKKNEVSGTIYGGKDGRRLAKKAVLRNGFISEIKGMKARKEKFKEFINGDLNKYAAYVNIGGGVSSISIGRKFVDKNVLLMNIDKIPKLIKNENGQDLIEYGGQKGVTGKGLLFYSERFSNWALLALLLSFGSVVIVGIKSYRQINKHMNSYEAESIL